MSPLAPTAEAHARPPEPLLPSPKQLARLAPDQLQQLWAMVTAAPPPEEQEAYRTEAVQAMCTLLSTAGHLALALALALPLALPLPLPLALPLPLPLSRCSAASPMRSAAPSATSAVRSAAEPSRSHLGVRSRSDLALISK